MISEAALDQAVAEKLITAEQAAALRRLAAAPRAGRAAPVAVSDDERLRFVSGFGDIFVTIGLGLFLYAAATLLGQGAPAWAAAAGVAALAWLLAEYFGRRRRMALPSIALLVVFVLASFVGLALLFGVVRPAVGVSGIWDALLAFGRNSPLQTAGAGLGAAALTVAHYRRFRVPLTIAAGAGGLVVAGLALLYASAPDLVTRLIAPIVLACGLAVFALAMRFDLADPARLTRRTDIAFWLHLLAAPLIVHSVFAELGPWDADAGRAAAVILVFALLGAVAIMVDRRALLVSGLVYASIAFRNLFDQVGLGARTFTVTLLLLGAMVLLLSAGWQSLRRLLLAIVPAALARRLPHPSTQTP